MKKVIYISWEHLSEKLERDWYISFLISRNVPIEYWDVTALLFDRIDSACLERDYVEDVEDYGRLENLLRKNAGNDVAYVLLIIYESRFYRLFRLLTTYGCKLYFIHWGHFPIRRKITRQLKTLIAHPCRALMQVLNLVLTTVSLKAGFVKALDVVFVAGYGAMPRCPPSTKIIPFNLCDYDNYLIARNAPPLIKERYCVFLDINLGYHPDVRIASLGDYVDPDRYMASLNRFFSLIENQRSTKVVIAAHPISQYKASDFDGRPIIKGSTPELVKDAEFVISHHSASLSYAVLNGKTIMFIYTDNMEKIYKETIVAWIIDIAKFLHAPVLNIDRIQDGEEISIAPADREAYDLYKYGYLTTKETEDRLNRDTFYNELIA